jgi:glycosyltransferase involved in cell wall biosynthesis
MQSVRQRSPQLRFVIVGDGPERAVLETQAKALGVTDVVLFAGNQKNVSLYLQAADLFLLPSFTEGISNALLEAMAAKVACLATPVGGNNEVLDQGKYGVMVPVEDVPAWADALVEYGNDESKRRVIAQKGRERILSTYDFRVVGAQYEQMYNDLLNENTQNG